jgi:hypothetical protein
LVKISLRTGPHRGGYGPLLTDISGCFKAQPQFRRERIVNYERCERPSLRIPLILITLFTWPEEGTADSMTGRWSATTDG